MQEEATEAKISDTEPVNADQQTASTAVTDTGTEAPSSSTVAPASSLSNDEIANGYRYGPNNSLPAKSCCYETKKILDFVIFKRFSSFENMFVSNCNCVFSI